MDLAALLLLADGRLPSGGHAHSAGVEAAVADGRVRDIATLEAYTRGRLLTTGRVEAALAAATRLRLAVARTPSEARASVLDLDGAAQVRTLAPPLRAASRRLGRQLIRVASRCWPAPGLAAAVDDVPEGLHLPVAIGLVGEAAGLDAPAVAALVVHHAIATPGQAAVKLLGLDPFEVVALAARLGPDAASVAAEALSDAAGGVDALPALGNPLGEIAAIDHGRWDVRMFAT